MARRAMSFFLLFFTLALVGCDHATKVVAEAALAHRGPIGIVPALLDLHYAQNRDVAFSLLRGVHFAGKETLLVGLAILGFVAIAIAWWRKRRAGRLEQTAYAILLAGALGNGFDRARLGYVVDFIEIHHWPIFNVADVAIVAGGLLLLIVSFRRRATPPLADLV